MIVPTVQVKGLEAFGKALERLDLNKQQRELKSAARAAMLPVLEDAQANIPVDSGLLKESLRIASRTRAEGDYRIEAGLTFRKTVAYEDAEGAALIRRVYGKKGLRAGRRKIKASGKRIRVSTEAGWRWHFVEFGVPGRGIPAKPFARPAMDRNHQKVLQIFTERGARLVQRLARQK